jgi:hypothetical protein
MEGVETNWSPQLMHDHKRALVWFSSVFNKEGKEQKFSGSPLHLSGKDVDELLPLLADLSPPRVHALIQRLASLSADEVEKKGKDFLLKYHAGCESSLAPGQVKAVEDLVKAVDSGEAFLTALPGCLSVGLSSSEGLWHDCSQELRTVDWSLRMSALVCLIPEAVRAVRANIPPSPKVAPMPGLSASSDILSWDKSDEKVARIWNYDVSQRTGGQIASVVLAGLQELLQYSLPQSAHPPLAVLFQCTNPVVLDASNSFESVQVDFAQTPNHVSFREEKSEWLEKIDETGEFYQKGDDTTARMPRRPVFLLLCCARMESLAVSVLAQMFQQYNLVLPTPSCDVVSSLTEKLLSDIRCMPGAVSIFTDLSKLLSSGDAEKTLEVLSLSEFDFCRLFPGRENDAANIFVGFLADDAYGILGDKPARRSRESMDENQRLRMDCLILPARKSYEDFPRRWDWDRMLREPIVLFHGVRHLSLRTSSLDDADIPRLRHFLEQKFPELETLDLSGNLFTPTRQFLDFVEKFKFRITASQNLLDCKSYSAGEADLTPDERKRLIELTRGNE